MKNTLTYIAIGMLLVLSVLFLVRTLKNKNSQQQLQAQVEAITDIDEQERAYIEELENENIGLTISDQAVFFGHDSLNTVSLLEFNQSGEYLYFYFSQNTCPPCIESTIALLKNYYYELETNNDVVFISPDYPARFRNNCYGKKLMTLENKLLGYSNEQYDVPFLFTLDKDLKTTSIHIVNKMNFVRTELFIKNRLGQE